MTTHKQILRTRRTASEYHEANTNYPNVDVTTHGTITWSGHRHGRVWRSRLLN